MLVICGDFNINHHTVSSKLKTLQEALLSFDLHYVENAKCTRETKASNSCIDAVYSNVNIDVTNYANRSLYALFWILGTQIE